jgi:molecular chaperone DnaK (HSP70)
MAARYLIGIDLGTTNTAVAYLDTTAEQPTPALLRLPQITHQGEQDERDTLPSFVYLPEPHEVPAGSLDLPWAEGRDFAVGAFARQQAALQPGKTVSSAKSWLCAPNVDRLAPILPWNRNQPDRQVSPVTAAQRILEHVRDAWNHAIAGDDPAARCEAQDIILTVPASFDAVARELTVQAAQQAGLQVTLLEEPQAAFYAWLQARGEDWRTAIAAGDLVLVCDLGGGTTDFSLIEVVDEDGNLALQRVAVGDHILLGGDNMDLTLAYAMVAKLQAQKKVKLEPFQLAGLTHACREAKEKLCADPKAGAQKLTVLGRGSSVIGGTLTVELTYAELQQALVDGFFPVCQLGDAPQEARRTGLRAFGLAYAADPGITRHLAAFLTRHHQGAGAPRLPTAILFNGGVTKATVLRERLVEVVNSWAADHAVQVLAGDQPDLAVALGACWYGQVRRGQAIRIKAGSPHSYYVGIEPTMPAVPGFTPPLEALCVVPFAMEEGTRADIPYSGLGLVVGDTTEFRFFLSANRPDDPLGTILPDAGVPDLQELPPLSAALPADDEATPPGTLVPVTLEAVLSEIGTLQLWGQEVNGQRRWKLQYELRARDAED